MRETWVKTNGRALWFGMIPPALIVVIGVCLPILFDSAPSGWATWSGVALIAIGGGLVTGLLVQTLQPRVAYADGQVLFHLRHGPPIPVPVELVEAFFLGQGPLILPGAIKPGDATVNLVARISQRDPSYVEREVKPALGRWSESYVTIRGTWCEPLDGELIRRLNRRLREVTEQRAGAPSAS